MTELDHARERLNFLNRLQELRRQALELRSDFSRSEFGRETTLYIFDVIETSCDRLLATVHASLIGRPSDDADHH
jgi:hypothetical protein